MKLTATFPPRRDGTYGAIYGHKIDKDGTVELDDGDAENALATGNFKTDEPVSNVYADADNGGNAAPEMIITNGDETINLLDLDKPELLAMAIEMELEVTGRNSAQTIRDAIMAHVTIEQ